MFPFWVLSFKRLLELHSAFGIYWWYTYLMLETISRNENLSICFLLGFWNASNRFWWFTSITNVIIRHHDIVGSDICFRRLVLVMTGFVSGWPNWKDCRPRTIYGFWCFRSHSALGRYERLQGHCCCEQRCRCSHISGDGLTFLCFLFFSIVKVILPR